MTNINDVIDNMERTIPESFDLSEFSTRQSGAWPRGWYPAETIEGYDAGGREFATGTSLSNKGDSYNLIVCFRVTKDATKEAEKRTTFAQINYRSVDFTPERMEAVKNLRRELAGVRGRWDGYTDEQRSSLALAQLSNFQKATSVPLTFTDGIINSVPFVGHKLFVRLSIDEETGYNEITGFSQYPNGVEPRKKGKTRA